MNILFVHEISWMRDRPSEIHTQAEQLSLKGHNVYASDFGTDDIGIMAHYRETDITRIYPGAKVHLIRSPFINIPVVNRLSYSFIYYNIIYKVLKDNKIDVVILYSAPTNGLQLILAARRLGIPVLFKSIDVLHKLAPKVLALPTLLAEKWVYRHVDKILAITPALKRYVIKHGANPDKVGILPLGIDLQCPAGATGRQPEGFTDKTGIQHPVMIFSGSLRWFSGLDNLIKMMPMLTARIPGIELLVIGSGVQRPELEKMVQDTGIVDCVKIIGLVPHTDVPKWIDKADIGVLTFPVNDVTRDVLPMKVLQYMAQGKPVVANPLPGLVDYGLCEKQGVVYVQDGDWGSAVEYAMQNKTMLGKKAREYVEQEHGHKQVAERLERELEMLTQATRIKY